MFKNEFDSLLAHRAFSRRDFVQTAVGSGFAAAVLPVGAQTIQTDTTGLAAGPVTIPVGGFDLPAYRAAPAGATGLPVVLVISEIFGCTNTSPTWRGALRSSATWPSRPICSCGRGTPPMLSS